MKKSLKGFTLIECLVSLAILGIASLTMAQIYSSVALRNRQNHELNASMSNQTSFIEKQVKNEGVNEFEFDESSWDGITPPSGTNQIESSYIQITELDSSGNPVAGATAYSYPIDVYLLKSRDNFNKDSDDEGYKGASESESDVRYKFFTAH